MAFATLATSNWFSEIDIWRLYLVFRLFTASTIDCVNARSFVALGATIATFSDFAGEPTPLGPVVHVVLLLQAAARSRTAVGITSNPVCRNLRMFILPSF